MTRVKVCGLTDPDQALACADLGVWAVGVVLWPQSPRACSVEAAEAIGQLLKRRAEVVGVFVDQPLDEIVWLADRCLLTAVQLHGHEGPAFCAEVARRTGCKVVKAVRVRDAASVRSLQPYHVDYHLLDAYVPGTPGGTGATFNWELARMHDHGVPVILAGGLNPDNVAAAIAAVRPFAVDVSSGVERRPGDKDLARVRELVAAVAAADRELAPESEAPATKSQTSAAQRRHGRSPLAGAKAGRR